MENAGMERRGKGGMVPKRKWVASVVGMVRYWLEVSDVEAERVEMVYWTQRAAGSALGTEVKYWWLPSARKMPRAGSKVFQIRPRRRARIASVGNVMVVTRGVKDKRPGGLNCREVRVKVAVGIRHAWVSVELLRRRELV